MKKFLYFLIINIPVVGRSELGVSSDNSQPLLQPRQHLIINYFINC